MRNSEEWLVDRLQYQEYTHGTRIKFPANAHVLNVEWEWQNYSVFLSWWVKSFMKESLWKDFTLILNLVFTFVLHIRVHQSFIAKFSQFRLDYFVWTMTATLQQVLTSQYRAVEGVVEASFANMKNWRERRINMRLSYLSMNSNNK